MLRFLALAGMATLVSACSQEEAKRQVPPVDLHGRLVVDEAMTASRQAQGIQGDYYQRVLTVEGQELPLNDFIRQYCPDANTRDEICQRALRIKKIDDVSGATRFLPSGL